MSICSSGPDTSGINEAAKANAAISKEALDWYKQTYADQAPARAQAADTAKQVSDAQIKGMTFATQQAQDDKAYTDTTFRPLEKGIVADAAAYDTPEKEAAAAQSAQADVNRAADAGNDALQRNLGRSGVAPGSAKAMSLMQDATINQAAAAAGAGTTAARNVQQQGYARKMDAAGLGRNLPSSQATQQQIAASTGTAAAGTAGASLAATTSGNGLMGQGFTTAISGNQSAGNLFGQAAGIEQKAQDSTMQGIGGLAALGTKLYMNPAAAVASDKNIKSGTGHMVNAAKALKQIEDTPVHDGWTYDPAKGGPNDGGQKHVGPMAQDVRKTMGNATAPGGKKIDIVSMNGRMMAAVQELSKRVKSLESHKAA